MEEEIKNKPTYHQSCSHDRRVKGYIKPQWWDKYLAFKDRTGMNDSEAINYALEMLLKK